jgi:alpha-galactosidase
MTSRTFVSSGRRQSRRGYLASAILVAAIACILCRGLLAADDSTLYLDTITPIRQSGRVETGRTIHPGRAEFRRGFVMPADSELVYGVGPRQGRFEAWVGPSPQAMNCTVAIKVYTDDQLAFDSGPVTQQPWQNSCRNPWQPARVRVPLAGAKELRLVVKHLSGDKQRARVEWGDARLVGDATPLFVRAKPVELYRLAPRPPMGWNSWNRTGPNINEKLIEQTADAMLASGMKDLGYVYISLDDGWQAQPESDAEGRPLSHKQRFPGGMKALADYMHQRGLKFGLYSRPAWTRGKEDNLAKTLAEWGVDYFKYDFASPAEHRRMAAATGRAGRPILFNACEWGNNEVWRWAVAAGCQSFRFTYDQVDKWHSDADCNAGIGIDIAFDQADGIGRLVRPGCWMDADAVLAGLRGKHCHPADAKGCSDVEYQTQFSFLCLLSATLMASCDLRTMDAASKRILTNREAIAIDQDPLGVPAWKARKLADLEVWQKPLAGGDWAVGLLNRGQQPATITARWIHLGLSGKYRARNIWTGRDSPELSEKVAERVAPHELVMLRLSAVTR